MKGGWCHLKKASVIQGRNRVSIRELLKGIEEKLVLIGEVLVPIVEGLVSIEGWLVSW